MKVIVAGLPRTGTTSMTAALKILLHGRVFDGGNVSYSGTYAEQSQMLTLASHCPMKTETNKREVMRLLTELTAGCVASSDQPGCYFVEEMLELYPDARVIVTTRERQSWWSSYTTLQLCIGDLYSLAWLQPQLGRFCRFSAQFWRRVPEALELGPKCDDFFDMRSHEGVYEAHAGYVKRVVPEDQLFYFDVKQGWEPLCKILEVPVPEGEFPHEFPRAWLTKGHAASMRKLRLRFAALVAMGSLVVGWAAYVGWRHV